MGNTIDAIGGLAGGIGVLCVGILLVLIGREIVCWYWKVNAAMVLLKNIDNNLSFLAIEARKNQDGTAGGLATQDRQPSWAKP